MPVAEKQIYGQIMKQEEESVALYLVYYKLINTVF